MNKVAFLFLTIDNLKHSSIWNEYFKDIDKNKFTIYVHPKNPKKVKDSILKNNIIDHLVETKHGFLVEAMVQLMKSAIKDSNNKFFIFVSDSCIPIKKFDIMYDEVFKLNKSIVGEMFLKKWNKEKRYVNTQKLVNFDKVLPRKSLIKFSQWSILTKQNVETIIASPYLEFFYKMNAGDEFYLSILNHSGFEYIDLPATYVDWAISDVFALKLHRIKKDLDSSLKKYNYGVGEEDRLILKDIIQKLKVESSKLSSHPREFNKINKKDIGLLKKSKAFFARKFSVDSDISKHIGNIW